MEVKWVLGGRYELLDQLGSGGMAVVWRARDEVLGRTVAIKLLNARFAGDPQSRQRIRDEARAAATLSHPNIAQVYDFGESDEGGACTPYVVMELVRGGTLQQRLAAGPVPARYAMRVGAEVAAALAAAHADGLVHRDIKPANVMVTPAGVKVVDFGIAAAVTAGGTGVPEEILGTPAYLAPERLTDDAVEPASDVYALGVLLYRLLTGHSPWTADTTTQMLTAHVYIDPTPLPRLPEVPDYVTSLCNRCLSKDPTQRPSARETATLLAQAAGVRVVDDELAHAVVPPPVEGGPSSVLLRGPAAAAPAGRGRPVVAGAPVGVVPAPRTPQASAGEPAALRAPGGQVPAAGAAAAQVPGSPAFDRPTPGAQGLAAQAVAVPETAVPDTPAPAPAAAPAAAAAPASAVASAPAGGASAAQPPSGSRAPAVAERPAPAPRPAVHRRRVWLAVVAVVLVGVATMLWLVLPGSGARDRNTATAGPMAGGASGGTPGAPSAGPGRAGPSDGSGARPGGGVPPAGDVPPVRGAVTVPAGGPAQQPVGPVGGGGGVPTVTAGPTDDAPDDPDPTTTTGRPAPTTVPPATTQAPPPVEERTLSSAGGSVRATCTSLVTAKLLSWTPTKPYKVDDVEEGPSVTTRVVFKHGNDRVRMTVTCIAGVPSAVSLAL